ncbi:thiamine kinase [Mycoplasmopsis californica]|uniref:Phosphotransferase n=1 Tax=Mycoplasmopsis equigenitalium TaxID=114883 RepID=A0ABY5J0V6_9BACT|nr:phosphotransferase [Mycoplasmopsis equigenitalium]UUD36884.1 phosphotransferase [Mycoplasmopsis equigenitalium]VEU69821.1 thiamine kinase [Mycoplasmopsis californica]
MQKITQGLTNYSYVENNTFVQEKHKNQFNHNIDYAILSVLNFVPKLILNTPEKTKWELIEGEEPKLTKDNIEKISDCLKTLHNSNLAFPKFNIKDRIREYLKILAQKGIKIPKIDAYYKRINKILTNMKKDTPCHNDLWTQNMVLKNDKLYIVDWEYATMGDKHFDLAYFIESSHLTDEQETILLDRYDDYIYEYILQQKILVNYLVVLWVNAQPKKYFDDAPYIKNLDKYHQEILLRRKKKED